jgi:hypothetical protein
METNVCKQHQWRKCEVGFEAIIDGQPEKDIKRGDTFCVMCYCLKNDDRVEQAPKPAPTKSTINARVEALLAPKNRAAKPSEALQEKPKPKGTRQQPWAKKSEVVRPIVEATIDEDLDLV